MAGSPESPLLDVEVGSDEVVVACDEVPGACDEVVVGWDEVAAAAECGSFLLREYVRMLLPGGRRTADGEAGTSLES